MRDETDGAAPAHDPAARDPRIDAFRAALSADPDDVAVRFGLAQALLAAARFAEAAIEFGELTRRAPRYTAAYRGLGRALEADGRPEEAIHAYEAGVAIACETGDLQTGHEMEVFLKRLRG